MKFKPKIEAFNYLEISLFRPLKEIPGKSLKASLIRMKTDVSGKVKSVDVKRKQEIAAGIELASVSKQVILALAPILYQLGNCTSFCINFPIKTQLKMLF